jgi:hypothetical protein
LADHAGFNPPGTGSQADLRHLLWGVVAMPTIEIVCIGQAVPLNFSDLPFVVEAESKVKSHRDLFTKTLDKISGCIYHLGNPNLKNGREGRYFFAYDLLSRRCQDEWPPSFLEFERAYVSSIRDMFSMLVKASPAEKLVFLTDWQFGPMTVTGDEISLSTFWSMHENLELRLNGLYTVTSG